MPISSVSVGEKVTATKTNEIIAGVNAQGSTRVIPTSAVNGSVSSAGVVSSTSQTFVRIRDAFPTSFTVFRCVFDITTSTAVALNLRFCIGNTDAGTGYDYQIWRGYSTTTDASQSLNQAWADFSPIGIAGGRHFGEIIFTTPNVATATLFQSSTMATLNPMTTSAGRLAVGGQLRTAAAYDSFRIAAGASNITIRYLTVEGIG